MPALSWSSDALAFTDTLPETLELSKGLLIVTTGAETSATTLLATFTDTDTAADDLVFSAASTATTTRVAIPVARPDVSQLKPKGAVVSDATVVPFTIRSTRVTPTLSEALTSTGVRPLTVVEPSGAPMETKGA